MPRAKTSLLGTPCARCLALGRTVPAIHGNVLCEDDVRRDLCDAHWKEVRALVGRAAKGHGQSHEAWLETHHDIALRLGIVAGEVEHTEPHTTIVHGKVIYSAPGIADYTGVLLDGRSGTLGVEAKSREERLYRHGKSGISPKQQRYLDSIVRGGGGLALLAVRFTGGSAPGDYVVPWQSVPWAVAKSAESVTAVDLSFWKIPADCRCYLERFCDFRGTPAPGVAPRRVYARE